MRTCWVVLVLLSLVARSRGGTALSGTGRKTAGRHEIFFKNITQILDHLLKDYDSSQHPNYKHGSPTTIRTNMLIRSMGPISELDMDYSMDCYFRQYWRDPRLSFRGPVDNLSLNIKMLERLWRPDTFFRNGRHCYVHTITLPNKLLRISQEGDILYSMRLTIKAKCPMCLKNFPLDEQSCPLIIGSYAYNSRHLLYKWDGGAGESVSFVPGMTLSQFDLISSPYKTLNLSTNQGEFSVLQVNFNLSRNLGNFIIQVYVPCTLIVILSWVSFWINREATSDRVGLGITAFLTLSTISIDSRTDLPKVHYATALDVFLLMSFAYCMASLLEFAGVHYFTKIGSGEKMLEEEDEAEDALTDWTTSPQTDPALDGNAAYNNALPFDWNARLLRPCKSVETKETQTERRASCFRQFWKCVLADQAFRVARQRAAALESSTNSVSKIDKVSRVLFPLSFLLLNILYWIMYAYSHSACERKN